MEQSVLYYIRDHYFEITRTFYEGENVRKMMSMLKDPSVFFESVRDEGWKPAFIFFLKISSILSVVTPIVNYFGIESTDLTSSYQAQIMAYRLLKNYLVPKYGFFAYLIEAILILVFSTLILIFLTAFLHATYWLMGGRGSVLNAWKAACYGVAPCIIGGFLPYISLFAGSYSVLLQFYMGPKILYQVKESRALVLLAVIIALIFIEMFVLGTTVGFF